MEVQNGRLDDYVPLRPGWFPLPCDVFVGVYMPGTFSLQSPQCVGEYARPGCGVSCVFKFGAQTTKKGTERFI